MKTIPFALGEFSRSSLSDGFADLPAHGEMAFHRASEPGLEKLDVVGVSVSAIYPGLELLSGRFIEAGARTTLAAVVNLLARREVHRGDRWGHHVGSDVQERMIITG